MHAHVRYAATFSISTRYGEGTGCSVSTVASSTVAGAVDGRVRERDVAHLRDGLQNWSRNVRLKFAIILAAFVIAYRALMCRAG